MMLECNLELVCRVLLFANSSKNTCKSTHGTRLCGVDFAIVLGIRGLERTSKYNYISRHDKQHIPYLVILYGERFSLNHNA